MLFEDALEMAKDPEFEDYLKDSDGLAKVALVGMDQSIASWTTFYKHLSA